MGRERSLRRSLRLDPCDPISQTAFERVTPATVDPVDARTRDRVVVSAGYAEDFGPERVSVRIGQSVAVLDTQQRSALVLSLVDIVNTTRHDR